MEIFGELSLLLIITTIIALVARFLRQPLVVGYIVAGIVAGPHGFDLVQSHHELELFAKVGIVFLLFIVGLHLNPKVIKEVGSVSLATGVGQVVFTALVGFGLALLLGIDRLAAMYVAIALTFSSTIIILKLLADKNDLQKLYAKIAIGFLLVQDIIATFILIGVTVMAAGGGENVGHILLTTLGKGLGLMAGLLVISQYVLPNLVGYIARSQELLFLFSLSWGTGLAALFLIMGFSVEIGALVAGVTLSVTPFADEVASRLKPLRDFFIIVFFILLGSQLMLGNLAAILVPALVLSVFVLVGNPIIVILLMNMLGYSRKTGFLAGLTVAQISEFSLILAALGMRVGHLSQEVLSLVTLVGLITIAGSTYLILYADRIYPKVTWFLTQLELIKKKRRDKGSVGEDFEAVLFGYDRVGHVFSEALEDIGLDYVVVDFNPHVTARLQAEQITHRFGDATDVEFLSELPLTKPRLVISTVPDLVANKLIVRMMKERNPRVLVITIAHSVSEARELYTAGAAYVMVPHFLGAEYAAKLIRKQGLEHHRYADLREKHLEKMEKEYAVG